MLRVTFLLQYPTNTCRKSNMNNKEKVIKNAEVLKRGINLLGRNRKTVLSHHKTFELTDKLEARIEEMLIDLKEEER